jgi:hypothetical protein
MMIILDNDVLATDLTTKPTMILSRRSSPSATLSTMILATAPTPRCPIFWALV